MRKLSAAMYRSQKKCSSRRGHEAPNYTLAEFREWLESSPQFKTLFDAWEESGRRLVDRPTTDRINPFKPYTLDNIQVMSYSNNSIKANRERSKIWHLCRKLYKDDEFFRTIIDEEFDGC